MTRVTKQFALAVAVLGLVLSLAACGSSSSKSAATGSTSAASGAGTSSGMITIHGFMFNPPTLTVKAGATITVKNTDDTDHTVTAIDGSFDTGPIHSGKTATFTVPKAGTFKFHCNIHNYMMGTIQVTS